MLTKADQLLCTISRRREKVSLMIIMTGIKISITSMDDNDMQVASVLEGSASKSDWAAIRRCLMIITTMEIWMEMMMT